MKHIALRSKSIRSGDRPYTTPGLGDRAHSVLLAYQYGKAHDTPVTLHLTSDKYGKEHKKISWKELTQMVPNNLVSIKVHPVCNLKEDEWLSFLSSNGYDAEIYYYKDSIHLHPNETVVPLEISQYLKELPCLEPIYVWPKIELPKKFITVQWDSNDNARSMPKIKRTFIENKYIEKGYDIVVVGGNSEHKILRESLPHIGYAMYHADYHVGVDSGMMHIAQFYKSYNQIHIHNEGFKSHHLYRAVKNGSKLNYTI